MNSPTNIHPKTITIITPVHNEGESVREFYTTLTSVTNVLPYNFTITFIDDGSTDSSPEEIKKLVSNDSNIRLIEFSRNFGKEVAITAGLHHASADAVIIIDSDLQHPVDLIPDFISRWENGKEVVVGVRKKSKSDSLPKRIGSFWFYKIMNKISDIPHVPQSTDYRLLDRIVVDEFNRMTERGRLTRGLIDWLGFKRDYIYFDAIDRKYGKASYGLTTLFRLALTSFVSMSLLPLRIAGYVGLLIMAISGILGIVMTLDRYIFPWGLAFSGTAILATMILFLVGMILSSLGILAFYIAHIHQEVQNRPLYVIRKSDTRP